MENLTVISWSTEDNVGKALIEINGEKVSISGNSEAVKTLMLEIKNIALNLNSI